MIKKNWKCILGLHDWVQLYPRPGEEKIIRNRATRGGSIRCEVSNYVCKRCDKRDMAADIYHANQKQWADDRKIFSDKVYQIESK